MPEIHKLQKEGEVIWPATTTSAIVDPSTRVVLGDTLQSWNLSVLWPDENVKAISPAVTLINSKLPAEKQIKGTRIEFVNAAGKNEVWEFIGGTGIAFNDITGWKEVGGSIISDLIDEVFPLNLGWTVSATVIPVGTSTDVTFSWNPTRNGVNISSDCTYKFEGAAITSKSKVETLSPTSYTTYTRTLEVTYRGTTKTASASIVGVNYSYSGVIAADAVPGPSSIVSFTPNLKTTKAFTASGITLNNQKYVYAYPAVLGDLTSIKDGNGFEYLTAGGFTKVTTAVNSVSYNIYSMTTASTVSGFKFIFS